MTMATKKGTKRSKASIVKQKATLAAKKASKVQSFPLHAIPDRPARKPREAKVTKAMEGEVFKAWQAPPLRADEASVQRAKMDILFGLISLANKVL